jgi:DNA-binding GntR family transcriptional regulator
MAKSVRKETEKMENRLKKIEDVRLSENAYDILKEAIITLKFAPGERMNLARITGELGISTTPVREAMNRLVQEGFVVNIPFKGPIVTDVDEKMVEDLAELRELLEVAAIRKTAAHITPGDVKAGEDLLEKLEEAFRENDVRSYVDYSMQFHNMFLERCGNDMMASVIRGFNDHVKRTAFLALERQGSISPFIEDYKKILKALKKRDPEEAGRLLQRHLQKVRLAFDRGEPA